MASKKSSPKESKLDEIISAIKENKRDSHCHHRCNNGGNAIYGLGILGMSVYYFQHMPVSSDIAMTVIKIILWPAFLLYRLLEISFF